MLRIGEITGNDALVGNRRLFFETAWQQSSTRTLLSLLNLEMAFHKGGLL